MESTSSSVVKIANMPQKLSPICDAQTQDAVHGRESSRHRNRKEGDFGTNGDAMLSQETGGVILYFSVLKSLVCCFTVILGDGLDVVYMARLASFGSS